MGLYDYKWEIGDVVRVVDRTSCTWRYKKVLQQGLVKCYDPEGRDYDLDTIVPIYEYLDAPKYFTLCKTDDEANELVAELRKEKKRKR